MKTMITVLALSIASIASSMAFESPAIVPQFDCTTGLDKFHGGISIVISDLTEYTATLSGSQSGGIAHYIRQIGPVNVKVTHEPDMTSYENSEEGILLTIVTTNIEGELKTTASFKDGKNVPAVSMTCQYK